MSDCTHEFRDAPFLLTARSRKRLGLVRRPPPEEITPQICARCGVLRIDPRTLPDPR